MKTPTIRRCPQCGKSNRVPLAKLADAGRCGACKATLPPRSEPVDVDAAAFGEVIAAVSVPVLVDFWAPWCGPCKMAAPVLSQLAKEVAGQAIVLKVNTEAHPDLAGRFGVRSIPNFVVLKHGKVVSQRAGLADIGTMRGWIRAAG